MRTKYLPLLAFALGITLVTPALGQQAVVAPPTPTLWRFLGIPQGLQTVRDVTVNRRGNHPNLERKPPLKRIGDPANLLSDVPAIKAAAEIKQAEDMKAQKIKALKYLASIGCGCYDKDGKVTDALLAATADCTPDVRIAAIEAIEETADACVACSKCGSTSCCSEKVSLRLSEIAYERGDDGCYLEPSAEVRAAAARALRACCPGGPPIGPIEEDIPAPVQDGTPGVTPRVEGGDAPEDVDVDVDVDVEVNGQEAPGQLPTPPPPPQNGLTGLQASAAYDQAQPADEVVMVGEMRVRPVVLAPVTYEAPSQASARPVAGQRAASASPKLPAPVTIDSAMEVLAAPQPEAAAAAPVHAQITDVEYSTGRIILTSRSQIAVGSSVTVYHDYLTGEQLVAHLIVKHSDGRTAVAVATDRAGLKSIRQGDRAVCHR